MYQHTAKEQTGPQSSWLSDFPFRCVTCRASIRLPLNRVRTARFHFNCSSTHTQCVETQQSRNIEPSAGTNTKEIHCHYTSIQSKRALAFSPSTRQTQQKWHQQSDFLDTHCEQDKAQVWEDAQDITKNAYHTAEQYSGNCLEE